VAYGPRFTFEINLKDNALMTMKDSKNLFKNIGLVGIGLCSACCLLPIAAVIFGVGALSVVSRYIEWVGISAMILAAVFFGIYYFRKRRGQHAILTALVKKRAQCQKQSKGSCSRFITVRLKIFT
jgi:protein-S-isoprenylcysteine O-methyltransferase Ste14